MCLYYGYGQTKTEIKLKEKKCSIKILQTFSQYRFMPHKIWVIVPDGKILWHFVKQRQNDSISYIKTPQTCRTKSPYTV